MSYARVDKKNNMSTLHACLVVNNTANLEDSVTVGGCFLGNELKLSPVASQIIGW
jgi:hypothetical protein